MRIGRFCLIVALFFVLTVPYAYAQEDIQKHKSCPFCGMDREKFAHSRVLIEYDDGTAFGACSVHCAAVDLAIHIDKTPKTISVGDYNSKKLIDAEKASWVIGGSKMGVMTKRAKWAFEKKDDAEAFIKENGGTLAAFDEVMKAVYEDMYTDTKMMQTLAAYHVMSEKELAREMKRMEKDMLDAAKNLEFEKAAGLRDKLAELKGVMYGVSPHDDNVNPSTGQSG